MGDMPLRVGLTAIVGVLSVLLALKEYGKAQGRLGRPMSVIGGGIVLCTLLMKPDVLTEAGPNIVGTMIDWAETKLSA